MTFESLAIAGLSIGLTYTDVLNINIGLVLGMVNEKNNQIIDFQNKNKKKEDEVVVGDGKMLMNM